MSSDGIRGIIRTLAQPVTYLGFAMLVAIYFTLTYLLITDRQTAEFDAGRRGDNLAQVVDRSFSHIFKSVDATLQFLRKSYQQSPSAFDLTVWAHDPSISNELTFAFMICDASGRVIDSSFSKEIIGIDRSRQEGFLTHANSAGDELLIGKPLIMKFNGKWAIPMSRRFSTPNGTFEGTVTALLDPSELVKHVGTIDLGPEGSIALVGLDSYLRTRAVNGVVDWENIGRQVRLTPETLGRAFQVSVGHYWSVPGVFNNVRRLVSYRVLESSPLISLVAIAEAEVYRRANENARIYWGIALVLTVAIAIAIGVGALRERSLINTKEALERSQERYTLAESAVNDGIWDWNIRTGEDYMSPRWKNILGYADDEVPNVESSFFELLHPDDKVANTEAVRAHLEENKAFMVDHRLRCKNGDYRWVQSRGKALRDAENRPVRMVGTITDITYRKKAEVLIKESHDNLARAEAMALLGHYKFDIASNMLTWSDGVFHILGKSPQTFNPTLSAVLDHVHPDDRSALIKFRHDVMAGLKPPRIMVRLVKDDGQIVYHEAWSEPIYASDGSVAGMFGTIQDVTARRQTEEALARLNRELETRVAEQMAQLAQEMRRREEAQVTLMQAQKMEAIGQLTAGVAHDFNNLLAVIKGSLGFVEKAAARGLTAEPELIDAALRATQRGRELVQRLLAFARRSPLKAELTAVDQLVLDTLRLLQRTLGERVEIVTRLDVMTAVVLVDRNQLVNALLNLALNARDAMPEGGQLTITTTCQPAQGTSVEGSTRWPTSEVVCIAVSDSGVGMTEEVRNRVFEPFFTTKTDSLGSGLGLSMVHGFVEQSGGDVDIDSAPGRGTTITIKLPKIASANQAAEPEVVFGSFVMGKEKVVLLVEDDPDVRVVTAAQLKELGYKVHAVKNGMEAIDVIASPADIDITLTDIVLPGKLDGIALVKEAMQARPRMGVLCMSGYDPTQSHRKWLEVQNIELLEKPFSSTRLAQALDDALAK